MTVLTGDDEPASTPPRWDPPDNEVPAILEPVILVATDEAAATLSSVRVFSTGVEITVECRRRTPRLEHRRARLFFEQQVYTGVELADGRRVIAARPSRHDGGFALSQRSGGGDDQVVTFVYWLAPAPPPGDLVVVVHAVDLDLPEARATLAAADLATARERVVELWPWAALPKETYVPPPEPDPPAGGWFAEVEPPA